MNTVLYLVIPCYNEEEVLPETSSRLKLLVHSLIERSKISSRSRVMFVDDGSNDSTWQIITSLHQQDEIFTGIKLSRNRGHQNALLAGLAHACKYADATISLDADLQDDLAAIEKMVDEYHNGCEVVYGVRSSRKTDSFFKRTTAQCYYKLMRAMGVDIVYNHADYRLMSRRAVEALCEFGEVNLFLRAMVPLVGFKTGTVEYERAERFAGKSKYPLNKMLAFAFDGITSFSVRPIRLILHIGIILLLAGFALAVWAVVRACMGLDVHMLLAFCALSVFLAGLLLAALGIVGEYVGRIYTETKHRPRFFVSQVIGDEEDTE